MKHLLPLHYLAVVQSRKGTFINVSIVNLHIFLCSWASYYSLLCLKTQTSHQVAGRGQSIINQWQFTNLPQWQTIRSFKKNQHVKLLADWRFSLQINLQIKSLPSSVMPGVPQSSVPGFLLFITCLHSSESSFHLHTCIPVAMQSSHTLSLSAFLGSSGSLPTFSNSNKVEVFLVTFLIFRDHLPSFSSIVPGHSKSILRSSGQ